MLRRELDLEPDAALGDVREVRARQDLVDPRKGSAFLQVVQEVPCPQTRRARRWVDIEAEVREGELLRLDRGYDGEDAGKVGVLPPREVDEKGG